MSGTITVPATAEGVLELVHGLLKRQRELYEAEIAKSDAENEHLRQHVTYLARKINKQHENTVSLLAISNCQRIREGVPTCAADALCNDCANHLCDVLDSLEEP